MADSVSANTPFATSGENSSDALGERMQMVPAVAAAFQSKALTRGAGELAQHLRRNCLAY